MKVFLPALAAMILAGCANTIATHRKDFSPTKSKGPWTDYYSAIKQGEKPEPPKQKK